MIEGVLLDKLTDLGLEVGKHHINQKLNEQLLRNKLKKYLLIYNRVVDKSFIYGYI